MFPLSLGWHSVWKGSKKSSASLVSLVLRRMWNLVRVRKSFSAKERSGRVLCSQSWLAYRLAGVQVNSFFRTLVLRRMCNLVRAVEGFSLTDKFGRVFLRQFWLMS